MVKSWNAGDVHLRLFIGLTVASEVTKYLFGQWQSIWNSKVILPRTNRLF